MAVGIGPGLDGVEPDGGDSKVDLAEVDPALSESEDDSDDEQETFIRSRNIDEVGLDEQSALDWLFGDESPAEWAHDISGCDFSDYPPGPWTSANVESIFSTNCFGGVNGLKELLGAVYSYVDHSDRGGT